MGVWDVCCHILPPLYLLLGLHCGAVIYGSIDVYVFIIPYILDMVGYQRRKE